MLRVRVLGELDAEVDGEPAVLPPGRRARGLLGWLALHPGQHARSDVAARFWPEVLETSARTSLRRTLADLTGALGPGGAGALTATRDRLGLDPDGAVVDLAEWEALVAQGRLEAALALDRGELLSGLDDDWVYAARDAHRARTLDVLERLAAAAEQGGDVASAASWARQAAAQDPLSEEIHRGLMRRLAATGDRAAALVAYERLRERMAGELSLVPSSPTRALAEELRGAGPSSDGMPAASPGGVRPVPLPPVLAALDARQFVGRAAALEELDAQWRRVREGGRRVVLLSGDPGIGKTRTASRFCAAAHTDGATVLFGRMSEEAIVPYQPFVEALSQFAAAAPPGWIAAWPAAEASELARIVPGLGAPLPDLAPPVAGDPAGDRYRLFAAAAAVLGTIAARSPVVIVLDDLHCADPPVLLLLEHLARSGPDGLLLLGTYRRAELGVNPRLAVAIDNLDRDGLLTRLLLEGLDEGEVGSLLGDGSPAELVRAVHDRTRGNPFFVEEIARQLPAHDTRGQDAVAAMGIPPGVKELIGRRLERLDPATLQTLEAAAVLGRRFDLAALSAMTGQDDEAVLAALEDAIRNRVVAEEGGERGWFAFHHQLVCDVCLARLTPSRQARLHAAAGRAIEGLPDRDERLFELARHFARSGAAAEATAYAERAGDRARELLAYEDAAVAYDHALATCGEDTHRRAALLLALADARERAGERAAARAAWHEAAGAARQAGDPTALAQAALGAAGRRLQAYGVDDEKADGLLDEATRALPRGEAALRARILARRAESFLAARPARAAAGGAGDEAGSPAREEAGRVAARRLGEDALALAREAGDPTALAAALHAHLWLLWQPGEIAERRAVAGELIDAARETGEAEWLAEGLTWRIAADLEACNLEGAQADVDAYARLAATLRTPHHRHYLAVFGAMRTLLEGRFAEGERLADEAAAIVADGGEADAVHMHAVQAMTARLDRGRLVELEPRIRDLIERYPGVVGWRGALTIMLADAGRHEEARAELDALAADDFAAFPFDGMWLPCLATATRATVALGAVEHAPALTALLTPFAADGVAFAWLAWWGPVALYLGYLALLQDDNSAAMDHFTAAIERSTRMGARPWTVHAQLGLAGALAARGDGEAARRAQTGALAEARALGMVLPGPAGSGRG